MKQTTVIMSKLKVWIIVLNQTTQNQFTHAGKYIPSLEGLRYLITDFNLLKTADVLATANLLGTFHRVIDRGHRRSNDPTFLASVGRNLGISRRQKCVYFDTLPGAIVTAQLQGWNGCLLAPKSSLRVSEYKTHRSGDHRAGRGLWYNSRFSNLGKAVMHYLFGRTSQE
tara:strand:- start:1512 stop:2018 length:507 start_codon:yes stop_codon:yes gene_type:complete